MSDAVPLTLPDPRRVEQVLLVSPPLRPPWRSGTTVLARDLALAGRHFRYRVLGVRGQSALGGTVHVERLYPTRPSRWITDQARALARVVRPDGCALHHFWLSPHPRASRALRAALRVSRKRSVHTVPSLPSLDAPIRELLFADHTVCVSEASALAFRSAGATDVSVIRPGVRPPDLEPDRAASRRRLQLCAEVPDWGDAPVALYAGDLEFSDGARTFLASAERAAAVHPELRFVFACRTKTPRATRARTELIARVARAGLAERVDFLGDVADMGALLGAIDLMVLPVDSLFAKVDTPLVVLQAMAHGRPVVVSDLPPLTELAGLGEGVVVARRSDPDHVADAMSRLVGDESLRTRLGQAARQTIDAFFRVDQMVMGYERIYRQVLG